jgi:predicted membrane-bound spermidine synthase
MSSRRIFLYLLVFAAGASTMGVEMCASRLLAPYFGSSLPVWGVVIGLLLAYLACGYSLGGRLADCHPSAEVLYQLSAWAALTIGLVPYIAQPILQYSVLGFVDYQAGPVLGSLFGVLALFAIPVILLGCVSPFAVRLSVEDTVSSGKAAGHIYALSTLGSLLGTFASVFLLIPTLGTRRTIFVISASLLAIATVGLLPASRRKALLYALLLALLLAAQLVPPGAIKPTEGMIYEIDSAYNYIQVLQLGGERLLKLNEGEGIQSSYSPQQILSGYVYDYFLLLPYFRGAQYSPPLSSMCLIGLAGGTTARQYHAVFGPIPIDGIEIDPAIIRVARIFFGLELPNLHIVAEDGRYYMAHSQKRYDVVLVDAYNPPYIPFQLTTVEFFQEVRDHLTADGIVGINVARTETDYALVDTIASTLKAIYPSVYVIDMLGDLNSVVVASTRPTELAVITERLAGLRDPVLSNVASRASGRVRSFGRPTRDILRDDHAPVEQIVHAIMARYLQGQAVEEVEH